MDFENIDFKNLELNPEDILEILREKDDRVLHDLATKILKEACRFELEGRGEVSGFGNLLALTSFLQARANYLKPENNTSRFAEYIELVSNELIKMGCRDVGEWLSKPNWAFDNKTAVEVLWTRGGDGLEIIMNLLRELEYGTVL